MCIRTKCNTAHVLHITNMARPDSTPLVTLLYIGIKSRICVDMYTSACSDTAILIAKEMGDCEIKSQSCTYTESFL